jgi:hypothetical protein
MKTQNNPQMVKTENGIILIDHDPLPFLSRFRRYVPAVKLAAFFLFTFSSFSVKAQSCKDCFVPSFGAITIYHVAQPGSNFGFGFEAGSWNKEQSRFSYFVGSKMQWFNSSADKPDNNSTENIRFSFYIKGQVEVVNRLYIVAAPEFVNLTSFEARAGVRYIFPISNLIGIGVEPGYSFVQKQVSLNTNIHFAL